MGVLVDERDRRSAGQDGVDVHLLEVDAAVGEHAARDDLEIADPLGGVRPAVRLDERHDDVGAAFATPMTLAEHGEGLADAGGGTDVHAKRPSSHHG